MPPEASRQGQELRGYRRRIDTGHYAVYHFLLKNVVRCTPEGEMLRDDNELGYLFENRADAQSYCTWKVAQNPKLGCNIYDCQRNIADQIVNPQELERAKRADNPKRQFLLGLLFLTFGCLLIWFDAQHNWLLIVGFLVGARFAVGGVVKILLSALKFFESRSKRG